MVYLQQEPLGVGFRGRILVENTNFTSTWFNSLSKPLSVFMKKSPHAEQLLCVEELTCVYKYDCN